MASSVWDRAREEAEVQLAELRALLDRYEHLLTDPGSSLDPLTAAPALGAILNSFYSGAENLIRRVLAATDGCLPAGSAGHTEVLAAAARATDGRPALIGPTTHSALLPYLRFRHLFRNVYAQWLDLDVMAPLGGACHVVLRDLEADVRAFFGHREVV